MGLSAVIDLGTNTFRLLIAEIGQASLKPIYSENRIARLGEGFAEEKQFRPNAMARALTSLISFRERLRAYPVTQVSVIGTSAFREAKNRDIFLASIREQIGFDVDVLSGEEEGRLTFLGANMILQHRAGPMLLIDIGGGSTEFIIAEDDHLSRIMSLPLGVISLTERQGLHRNSTKEGFKTLQEEIQEALRNIEFPKGAFFAGTAGTVTTLAAMDQKMASYNPDRINRYRLSRVAIDCIFDKLSCTPLDQRHLIPGLEKGREDLIPTGIVLLQTMMDRGYYDAVTVSDYGLREGVLMDRFCPPKKTVRPSLEVGNDP